MLCLFPQLCKVVLNAPAQAKQHYEGKNHSRKLKMFLDGQQHDEQQQNDDSDVTSTTTEQVLVPN